MSGHKALVWLFSLKEQNEKAARWLEILAPYDFAIEYRPGVKQGHCDALTPFYCSLCMFRCTTEGRDATQTRYGLQEAPTHGRGRAGQ